MYAKINNGSVETYPYTIGQLRKDNPNVSFPRNIPAETLEEFGVYQVDIVTKPEGDIVVEGSPVLSNGTWTQTWEVSTFTPEQLLESNTVSLNNKMSKIASDFHRDIKVLENGYTDKERESWDLQREEAKAYSADNTADVPLLTSMAAARNLTVAEMSDKILNNFSVWTSMYGTALGTKQRREDELEAIDLTLTNAKDLIDAV